MSVFYIFAYCFLLSICVLSEFIVSCTVYCMFWLPYGIINDDDDRILTTDEDVDARSC